MAGNTLRLPGDFLGPARHVEAKDLVAHGEKLLDLDEAPPSLLSESRLRLQTEEQNTPITLAAFVKSKFVPECVVHLKLAGRTHFQFILRLVLTPEQVADAFGTQSQNSKPVPKSAPDWPYLGSMPLHLIDHRVVQFLTSTALKAGYSTQTAIHIRNVVRSIFVHAIKTKHFVGDNPASLVLFPAVMRKASPSLTIPQLKQTMQMMRYPEKQMALCAILTDMNLSEICGLQWKNLNLSPYPRLLNSELLQARTIAVRNQSYRGEFRPVIESRRRFIPIPDALFSLLCDLKSRGMFSGLHDFVFASRRGTPINPDNFGTRRIKTIGRTLDMPWLSWSVFQRTHVTLKSQFGQRINRELEQILPLNDAVLRNRQVEVRMMLPRRDQTNGAGVE